MKNNLIIFSCAALLLVLGVILVSMTPYPKQSKEAAADHTTHSWYIMPKTDGSQPIAADDAAFKDQYEIIYLGDPSDPTVWLTFDLGYENGNTAKILDVLKEKNAEAAFFICGNVIDRNPELVKRMTDEGHTVCNHTNRHTDLSSLSKEAIAEELKDLEDKYFTLTGKSMSKLMRPPEGKYSENTLAILNELGYTPVFWSFAYKDWLDDAQPTSQSALDTVSSRAHNGMVMLLHSTSATNASIMGDMIDGLRADGYTIGTIAELAEQTNIR